MGLTLVDDLRDFSQWQKKKGYDRETQKKGFDLIIEGILDEVYK